MANSTKKELAQKLESGILEILQGFHPNLGKKLSKDARKAGKDLSRKLLEMQEELEKKARKALKKEEKSKAKARARASKKSPADPAPSGKVKKPARKRNRS